MKRLTASACLLLALLTCTGAALADTVTYANDASGGVVGSFGQPNTSNYGEAFTLGTAATLNSLSFYASNGTAGNLELVIAPFTSGAISDAPVYTSAPLAYSPGGVQALTFSGISTLLSAGTSYIAYITTVGVSSPVSSLTLALGGDNGMIGTGFYFLNSGNTPPGNRLWTLGSDFYSAYTDLQFTANFTPVPVPAAVWLLLSGLGGLGVFSRRRSVAAVAQA